jgi:predicted ATPase
VLISGEAGLGKSRLVAALEQRLDLELHLRVRYFCSAYTQDSALFPLVRSAQPGSGIRAG